MESDRALVLVDIRLPSLTYYLDRVPERITSSEVDARLDRPDAPMLIIAAVDLERIPRKTLIRLRQIGRSGKLHLFVVGGPVARSPAE